MGSLLEQLQDKSRVNRRKMGATRFFIFSTFLALMFGFALSLPTVGNEYPEQVSGEGLSRMIRALGPASNGTPEGLLTRFRRSPFDLNTLISQNGMAIKTDATTLQGVTLSTENRNADGSECAIDRLICEVS